MKNLLKCLRDALFYTAVDHDGIEHAGYLAFLGLLSLFPFLVFLVMIAGTVGEAQIGSELVGLITDALPENLIAAIRPRMAEIVNGPPQGLVTLAILGMIWTSSSIVEGTRNILNKAYRVETPPSYLWRRFMSILQMFILVGLTITAMLIFVSAPILWNYVEQFLAVEWPELSATIDANWNYIRYTFSGVVVFLVVATSYYILPNVRQRWRRVVPGALLVVVLWLVVANALVGYLQNYIFGAEFNYFYEKSLGFHFVQKEEVPGGRRKIHRGVLPVTDFCCFCSVILSRKEAVGVLESVSVCLLSDKPDNFSGRILRVFSVILREAASTGSTAI